MSHPQMGEGTGGVKQQGAGACALALTLQYPLYYPRKYPAADPSCIVREIMLYYLP